MKKLLLLLLTLALCLGAFTACDKPTEPPANDDPPSEQEPGGEPPFSEDPTYPTASAEELFVFEAVEGGYAVKEYLGTGIATDVVIPQTHQSLPVVSIGERAFAGISYCFRRITIPPSVAVIEKKAFDQNYDLTEVVFWQNSQLEILYEDAFRNTTLRSINLPPSLRIIGTKAFSGADLESIHIPAGVESIDDSAFYCCDSLTEVTFASDSALQTLSHGAFMWCGKLEKIVLPEGLPAIGPAAFWGCTELREVYIPASVKTIGVSAFVECTALTEVTFAPNSLLESIEQNAFDSCTHLRSINLPTGLLSIGAAAFSECERIDNVVIPENVIYIGPYAFETCYALYYVTFENTRGWTVCTGTLSEPQNATRVDTTDRGKNTSMLKRDYLKYHWYRE